MKSTRTPRAALVIEVALGALPITIVGGFYAVIGIMFSITSILVSIYERSIGALAFWLPVFALAAGGLIGIVGLWLLVTVFEFGGTDPLRRTAVVASGIGMITAATALALALRHDGAVSWQMIYLLVSPVLVAGRRFWLRSPGTASTAA